MPFISSFDIISVVLFGKAKEEEWRRPDPKIFLCIPASVAAAAAAAVNLKGIDTLLADGLITFFIKGNHIFSNGPRSLPRNPLDYTIFVSKSLAKTFNLSIS